MTEEKELLLEEYRQLCEDFRMRDKYVLDKFIGVSFVSSLIGFAYTQVSSDCLFIEPCLLFIGALFSLIAAISVKKDTYYRYGSANVLKDLSNYLKINYYINNVIIKKKYENKNINSLRWIKLDKGSENWFIKQTTFKWIFSFYLIIFFMFVSLFIFELSKISKVF
jgi:hypothetical protein